MWKNINHQNNDNRRVSGSYFNVSDFLTWNRSGVIIY